MPERDESARVAGVAGRGLGLVVLVALGWKVLAQGLTGGPRDLPLHPRTAGLLGSAETVGRLLFTAGALTMLAALLLLALELLRGLNAPPTQPAV